MLGKLSKTALTRNTMSYSYLQNCFNYSSWDFNALKNATNFFKQCKKRIENVLFTLYNCNYFTYSTNGMDLILIN